MTPKPNRTAVIGLGAMGYGVAQSCLRAGHETIGIDVVPAQMERFQSEGGLTLPLTEAAGTLDQAVVVVLNAAQLETVLFGEAALVPQLRPGAVVIACPTIAPEIGASR